MQARWEDCRLMLEGTLKRREKLSDVEVRARGRVNLAEVVERLGNHAEAITHCLNALKELGDRESVAALRCKGLAARIIGNAYRDLKNWGKSSNLQQSGEYFYAAYKASGEKEFSLFVDFMRSINYRGVTYEAKKDWENALKCYEEALAICIQHQVKIGEGRIYGNIGYVHFKQNRIEEASDFFHKSLEIATDEKVGDEHSEARMLMQLAKIDLLQENYESAKERATKSLKWLREAQDVPMAKEVEGVLSEIAEKEL